MSRKKKYEHRGEEDSQRSKDNYYSKKREEADEIIRELAESFNAQGKEAYNDKSDHSWMARRDRVIAGKFAEEMQRQLNEFYDAREAYGDCT